MNFFILFQMNLLIFQNKYEFFQFFSKFLKKKTENFEDERYDFWICFCMYIIVYDKFSIKKTGTFFCIKLIRWFFRRKKIRHFLLLNYIDDWFSWCVGALRMLCVYTTSQKFDTIRISVLKIFKKLTISKMSKTYILHNNNAKKLLTYF